MNAAVLTIFPEMFDPFLTNGMIKRAIDHDRLSVSLVNIRDFAAGRHRVTDDRPYGGGCGMLLKPEPLAGAIRATRQRAAYDRTILLSPQGRPFNQPAAEELASLEGFVLVCGRYEGVDERIVTDFIDDELSIGDYILTGGELAAMVIIDAVTRLIPGVLGGAESAEKESFNGHLLEHAQYTRPREFEGQSVPEVLQSGNHKAIDRYRFEASVIRTFLKRRDLLEKRSLGEGEIDILRKWAQDIEKIIDSQSLRGAGTLSGGQ